jgi:membrane protein implicated in regulation of membrane protease activity
MVPGWLIWIVVAAALAAAETLSLDLVLIMLAGGAAAGAVTAAAGGPAVAQVAVAVGVAVALLVLVRPVARRHLLAGPAHVSGAAALVGRRAVVTSTVDHHHGRVRLNGGEWSARAYDLTQVIPDGVTVQVVEIDGATAVVWDPDEH